MRKKEKEKFIEMQEKIYLLNEEMQRLCVIIKELQEKSDGKEPIPRRITIDEEYDRLREKYRPHMKIFMDGL